MREVIECEKDVKCTSERIMIDPISKKSKIEVVTSFVGEELSEKKS